ncbi:MAG: hypothetical protein K1X88_01325 [Nannocystaceae bacterium]|nr:hypothetical protein [Nannocystaceae bacterium]
MTNSSLDALLLPLLPPGTSLAADALQATLRAAGVSLSVALAGMGRSLLQVVRTVPAASDRDEALEGSTAMLQLQSPDGALRIDVPVSVVAVGVRSVVLRLRGAPLCVRRRAVRDTLLAEAVGAPRAAAPAPLEAPALPLVA